MIIVSIQGPRNTRLSAKVLCKTCSRILIELTCNDLVSSNFGVTTKDFSVFSISV